MTKEKQQGCAPNAIGSLFGDLELTVHTVNKGGGPKRAASRAGTRQKSDEPDHRAVGVIVTSTRPNRLKLHPNLKLSPEDLQGAASTLVDEIADQFRRGIAPAEIPRVVALDSTYFGATTALETVVAAQRVAAEQANFEIDVLVDLVASGANQVISAFHNGRHRSGWEQYGLIASVFGNAKVRAKLRELDLPIEKWEFKISKVLKVGRLDPVILEAVNKLTIPIKEAGQVVDGWRDEEKRSAMLQVLEEEKRGINGLLDAKALFRKLLRAGCPDLPQPVWEDGTEGERILRDVDGKELATLTMAGDRWRLEGALLSPRLCQHLVKALPAAKL